MNTPSSSPAPVPGGPAPAAPRRSALVRLIRWTFSLRGGLRAMIFLSATGLTLLVLAVSIYNFYGERQWRSLEAALKAKGVPLAINELIPPEVPDDRNLAMTPLLAPLFKIVRMQNGRPVWADEEGRQKLIADHTLFAVEAAGRENLDKSKPPAASHWRLGQRTDLLEWQDYYSQQEGFPHPTSPGSAAADVLMALSRNGPQIAELEAAAASRPHVRFGVRYDTENPAAIMLPHLAWSRKLSRYCQLSAIAMLADSKQDKALERLALGLRFMEGVDQEPILISQLVRLASWQILSHVIWEGLATRAWKPAELARLKEWVSQLEFIDRGRRAIEGERAFGNGMFDRWASNVGVIGDDLDGLEASQALRAPNFIKRWLYPKGMLRLNQTTYNRCMTDMINAWGNIRNADGSYRLVSIDDIEASMSPHINPSRWHNIFVRLLVPALAKVHSQSRLGQSTRDLALVAIALEQHRLERDIYPERLEELTPKWLDRVPGDVFSGKPLVYRRHADGHFQLYSVGMDGEDQEGQWPSSLAEANGGREKRGGGGSDDVVWSYPRE